MPIVSAELPLSIPEPTIPEWIAKERRATVADRDESGRKIIGRSSGTEPAAAPPAVVITGRPVIGRSAAPRSPVSGDRRDGPTSDADAGGGGTLRKRQRRRLRRGLVVGLILLALLPISVFFLGWWQYSKIPTVDIADLARTGTGRNGTNYLIVGTDSRSGMSASDPNAGAFLAEAVSGARTDTIMVLHIEGSTSQLASIPRDLWVTDPATGQMGRINSTFASGPSNLVAAVESLGVPIDGYFEINFVSFAKLVDAIGGITIDVAHPSRDDHSGLAIAQAGPTLLDGSQTLAYVRSRYYEELVDGKWQMDRTSDLGRTERQRAFFAALLQRLTTDRNPVHLFTVPGSIGTGLRHSSNLSYLDALRLLWMLKDGVPQPIIIPVTPRRTSGGAEVLELQPAASAVLASLAQ